MSCSVFDVAASAQVILDRVRGGFRSGAGAVDQQVHALGRAPALVRVELVVGAARLVHAAEVLLRGGRVRDVLQLHDALDPRGFRREDEYTDDVVVMAQDVIGAAADEDRGAAVCFFFDDFRLVDEETLGEGAGFGGAVGRVGLEERIGEPLVGGGERGLVEAVLFRDHGDQILVKVAREIKKLFRSDDIVARMGGDEFMILMKNINNLDLVEKRCEQILASFDSILNKSEFDFSVGASIGVAYAPSANANFLKLYMQADEASYEAKRNGRHQFIISKE